VGAVVPTQDIIQHTGEMQNAAITLTVGAGIEPGKIEISKIHQDAGDGYAYRQSAWREIRIEHRQGLVKITRLGDFNGQRIRWLEVVGLAGEPNEVRANGKKIDMRYESSARRLRVELPDNVDEVTLTR
jgi:hypothetical protein